MRIPIKWLKDYVDTGKSERAISDSFTALGLMLDKPIGDDNVLDLEQRLNRSDLLSVLGCARDLAAFEQLPLLEPKIKRHPLKPASKSSRVAIRVDSPAVRRFNTRVFLGLKVGPSPAWLKDRLELYGVASKNNIVDVTNFVMLEIGQPMHAQDIGKLPEKEIHIRPARRSEKITTLLGTTVELDATSFVLASGGVPQVIGGIVGGIDSGVTNKTTNIVLDAGSYDPVMVRMSSRHLKIMNETVTRYDKPLDPRLTELALDRATDLILEIAGGQVYQNDDYYPVTTIPQTLALSIERLRLISGLDLDLAYAKNILQSLGYSVTDQTESSLTVEVPLWRTDIEVEDDLVSDVLRMYNYQNIPVTPLVTAIPPDITPELYEFEDKLRDYLVAGGGHEHITSSLLPHDGNGDRVVLANALSTDASALRVSVLENLHSVQLTYRKHGLDKPILFELGNSFRQPKHEEIRELGIIDPVSIRSTLATLLHNLGLDKYLITQKGGTYLVVYGDSVLGTLFDDAALLSTSVLMSLSASYPPLISDYGLTTSLDLSLKLPAGLTFDKVIIKLRDADSSLYHVEVVEEYQDYKLVRLSWKKQIKNIDKTRLQLVKALKEIGITTRSELE